MILLICILTLNINININIDDFRVFDNKTLNVYEISGLNAREINKRLVGTFLEDTGDMMYHIEQEKGINFRVIYAIAGLESGKGEILSGKNNYCGIKDTKTLQYKDFDSRQDCLIHLAGILDSKFYRGRSLDSIGRDYCPPDPTWSRQVREIMGEI